MGVRMAGVMFTAAQDRLVPFMLIANKLYFTTPSHHAIFLDYLRALPSGVPTSRPTCTFRAIHGASGRCAWGCVTTNASTTLSNDTAFDTALLVMETSQIFATTYKVSGGGAQGDAASISFSSACVASRCVATQCSVSRQAWRPRASTTRQ